MTAQANAWLKAYCAAVYSFLYLPIAVMMVFSFNDSRRNVLWKGFTFRWYGKLLGNTDLMRALWTSLQLAFCATLIAAVFGILASYAMARHRRFPARRVYAGFLNVPMMLPEIVLGAGLLSLFVRSGMALSFWGLVWCHVIFCLPYAAGAIRARLMSLKSSVMEDAAMDLGATEWRAFLRVTLPLAWPAVLSGSLLAFTVSFENFVISFFMAGIGTVTLPMHVYSMMKFGLTPEVNAMAACLTAFTVAVLLLYRRFGPREDSPR